MSLGTHSGCPKTGVLSPGQCRNEATVALQYEGQPIHANQKEAVQFLRQTAGKLLIPNWQHVSETQMHGNVQVCVQCQQMIQKHARIMSPLDSLKFTMHRMDTMGRQVHDWGKKANFMMNMAGKVGVPYAQEGAQLAAQASKLATQVTPSLQVSKALTMGMAESPVKGIVQSMVAGKVADFAQGKSVMPEQASAYVSQMLQKLQGSSTPSPSSAALPSPSSTANLLGSMMPLLQG